MLPTGRNAAREDMSPKICWSGFSEDTSMKTMGNAATTAKRRRTSMVPVLLRSSWFFMSVFLPGEVALHRGDDQHQDEEHQRNGGGKGRLLLPVAGPDGLVNDGGGRIHRAALGHHADLVEQAQGLDGNRDQDQAAGVEEPRPGHVAELLPPAGSVQLRRLVQLA